ncbi:hypothetical protein BMS3Abin03_01102 [bacterium BMS3Abin03]|nr:hypothetical protein BMS3Abin03_01102 [bacterium BMS3Abin03]
MNKKLPQKYLVETDVPVNYLTETGDTIEPGLIMHLQNSIAFTMVMNASELFYAAKNEFQLDTVKKNLTSLKIFVLNPGYSLSIFKYSSLVNSVRDALFCIVADFNKLPVAIYNVEKYKSVELNSIHPKELRG